VSQWVAPAYEQLAIVFSHSVLRVNFGFWVGSLWGDYPGESCVHGDTYTGSEVYQTRQASRVATFHAADYVFVAAWAALFVGIGIWGARAKTGVVWSVPRQLGAIHFYMQWFERLGAQPWAIISPGSPS
jgi:iron complex transport system permease protein